MTPIGQAPKPPRKNGVATVVCIFTCALAFGATARADVVTDWNTAALNAIRTGGTPPPIASRALAILHAAIFDAVNGISRTHDSYRVESVAPRSASVEAAASAAAHATLVALFPDDASRLDALYASALAGIPDGPRKRAGIEWGETVAAEILAWRLGDNADATVALPPVAGAGTWQPTPPAFSTYALPQWAFVAPFAMPSSSYFRSPGPPALDSPTYARDFDEVKTLGAASGSSRTAEQDLIALFWADGAGTETPPGHWNTIAQGVARAAGNTVERNARLFALLNLAMADAAICAWDAKYYFFNWRPVTAIRNADSDGNAGTMADPSWISFIATPPFPDYVSGHSTFSGAAATVMALFYGSDDIAFATTSDGLPGVTRRFTSFSQAAAEAAVSRVYGGIHFRFASDDGLTGGVQIGQWVMDNYLRPKGNHSRR